MTLTLTLLGTGTSQGVPEIGCKCAVCQSDHPCNKRLRSSAWLHSDAYSILFDCSSDFRQQALRHNICALDAVFISHAHFDHVGGIDDIRAFNRISGKVPLYILEPEAMQLQRTFYYLFEPLPQRGGGISEVELFRLGKHQRVVLKELEIHPLLAFHGVLPILGFRVGNTAYFTDVKTLPLSTIEALRGIDQLVINALRHRPHPTHMNIKEMLVLAEQIQPERVYLTHTTHDLDYEATNKALPAGIEMAFDGLELEVKL